MGKNMLQYYVIVLVYILLVYLCVKVSQAFLKSESIMTFYSPTSQTFFVLFFSFSGPT